METNRLNEVINELAIRKAEQDLDKLKDKFLEILPPHLRYIRIKGQKLNGQEFDFSLEYMFVPGTIIGSEIVKKLKNEYADKIIKDILNKAGYEAI